MERYNDMSPFPVYDTDFIKIIKTKIKLIENERCKL